MKRFNSKRLKYEWMRKYPWLARIYLALTLVYVPTGFVVLTLYEYSGELKEVLSDVFAAAFLPWEEDDE